MYYFLIGISALMFGLQFFFNSIFQKEEGNDLAKALIFSILTSVVGIPVMLIISGKNVCFSLFSFWIALLSALVGIGFLYCSAYALDKVNLSVYSLFSMLGGMILPVICGIIFFSEGVSVKKLLCIAVISCALFFAGDLKADKKTGIYCIAIFILNGMNGVLSKCHQSSQTAISSSNFMLLKSIVTVVICVLLLSAKRVKFSLCSPKKSVLAAIGYGLMNSVANFFVLIALLHVNASVQYPMITGGTIVVSVVISLINKEKVTYKNIFACFMAFAATLLIIE